MLDAKGNLYFGGFKETVRLTLRVDEALFKNKSFFH